MTLSLAAVSFVAGLLCAVFFAAGFAFGGYVMMVSLTKRGW